MNTQPDITEAIVRNHLQAFVEQKGIDAILSDYDDNARFHSEARTYQGKQEIGNFFASFGVETNAAGFCSTMPSRASHL